MSNKLPALQFYVGDWKKDNGVQSLSYEDRGIWFEMLCLMHESPVRGFLQLTDTQPMPLRALATLLGLSETKVDEVVSRLVDYGVCKKDAETGVLFNKRMVEDERIRQLRKASGSLGGNPKLKATAKPAKPVRAKPASKKINPNTPHQAEIEMIFEKYPRKVAPDKAKSAIKKVLMAGDIRVTELMMKVEEFASEIERHGLNSKHEKWNLVPHGSTWFNQHRYLLSAGDWTSAFRDGKHVAQEKAKVYPKEPAHWRETMASMYPSADNTQPWTRLCDLASDIANEMMEAEI